MPCPPPPATPSPSVSPRCQQIVPTHRGRRRSINCGFHICSEVSGQKDSSGPPLSYTLYFYRPLTAVRGVTWNSFRSAASARGRAQICFDSIPAKKMYEVPKYLCKLRFMPAGEEWCPLITHAVNANLASNEVTPTWSNQCSAALLNGPRRTLCYTKISDWREHIITKSRKSFFIIIIIITIRSLWLYVGGSSGSSGRLWMLLAKAGDSNQQTVDDRPYHWAPCSAWSSFNNCPVSTIPARRSPTTDLSQKSFLRSA